MSGSGRAADAAQTAHDLQLGRRPGSCMSETATGRQKTVPRPSAEFRKRMSGRVIGRGAERELTSGLSHLKVDRVC